MVRPQRYFPWRVARHFFLSSLLLIGVLLLIIGFSLRIHVYQTFLTASDIHLALSRFDGYLTSLLSTVFLIAVLVMAIFAGRQARPLGRLIQRARELRRLDAPSSPDEIPDEDEPGEWYDLERALNRIHKDLRLKTLALSREREELSTLIGAVSDAILAVDRNEAPLFFNSQFAQSFPVAGQGQAALTLSETFRVPDVLQGYREVLKTGEKRIVTVTLLTSSSPLQRHFSISIAPLKAQKQLAEENEDDEEVDGAIGIFHDVTELKQSEQIRIEFVGNASHELRTPLTNIKGYVETLRDDVKNGRYAEAPQFVDVIARNVDRLIYLVNDLLDLSALESGAVLDKALTSTREVTESALRQLDGRRAAKNQEIRVQYKVETVMADARRLEQVVINLVHNAVKYTPDGSKIDVIWEWLPDGGMREGQGATVLRIRDNGPGIPLEHQSRLFERFYRVDAGRSREQGGTGLGLSIVKHIMIKHGGLIRVQSRRGEGAEFICVFP